VTTVPAGCRIVVQTQNSLQQVMVSVGIQAFPPFRSEGQRPAASLLAAAGALALVTAGLLNHPLRLPLALIALCIALMAAWTALVHHGTRRVLAGVVAVVALVGLVALLDLRSIVRIIVVIGLVLVSAAAARVALAHDLAAATFDGRKVGPARSGVLLMNPWWLAPPLRFRSLPGALRVRIPVDAPGTSRPALRHAGGRPRRSSVSCAAVQDADRDVAEAQAPDAAEGDRLLPAAHHHTLPHPPRMRKAMTRGATMWARQDPHRSGNSGCRNRCSSSLWSPAIRAGDPPSPQE
jgi:hypothetical protein